MPHFSPSLQLRDLLLVRGSRAIAARINLTLQSGDALLLRGPNGAGKTSLLRALAGLLPPQGGKIIHSLPSDPQQTRCWHYIGHENALSPALSVAENIDFSAAMLGQPPLTHEAVRNLCADWHFSTPPHFSASALSAGSQRKLALMRLDIAPAPLWLLDEPAAFLDAPARVFLQQRLAHHLAQGGMAIVAGHENSASAEILPKRVGVLSLPEAEFSAPQNSSPQKSTISSKAPPSPPPLLPFGALVRGLWALMRRDAVLAWRQQGFAPLAFFFLAAAFIPFAAAAPLAQLQALAPIMLWVLFLAVWLFSGARFFASDAVNGVDDFLFSLPFPPSALFAAKCAAHLPQAAGLAVIASLAGLLFFNLTAQSAAVLGLSFLLALPVIITLAALPAVLIAGLPRAGVLAALLVLPLFAPLLLFGSAAASLPLAGFFSAAPVLLLFAASLLAVLFMPWLLARAARLASV